jgi:hypothetical protein
LRCPGVCVFKGQERVATLAIKPGKFFRALVRYYESLRTISDTIERAQPDLIVNFLEPLMGVFNLLQPHPNPGLSRWDINFKTGSVAQIFTDSFRPADLRPNQRRCLLLIEDFEMFCLLTFC